MCIIHICGFPGGLSGKESTCQCRRCRRLGWIPGWGRSPGGGSGNHLQYSCLGNPMHTSVQFSRSVVCDSLRPHGLQHARIPCSAPTPGVYSNLSIESVMTSNHLILCRPLLLLPSIFPSIRVYSDG